MAKKKRVVNRNSKKRIENERLKFEFDDGNVWNSAGTETQAQFMLRCLTDDDGKEYLKRWKLYFRNKHQLILTYDTLMDCCIKVIDKVLLGNRKGKFDKELNKMAFFSYLFITLRNELLQELIQATRHRTVWFDNPDDIFDDNMVVEDEYIEEKALFEKEIDNDNKLKDVLEYVELTHPDFFWYFKNRMINNWGVTAFNKEFEKGVHKKMSHNTITRRCNNIINECRDVFNKV
jgi:hypothetical protein